MSGGTELVELLKSLAPELSESEFVFCAVSGELREYYSLNPLATFIEAEGLTLILEKSAAEKAGLPFERVFKILCQPAHRLMCSSSRPGKWIVS